MHPLIRPVLALALLVSCGGAPPAPPSKPPEAAHAAAPAAAAPAATPARPKTDAEKTVLDVAVGSPDHTTLVAAVKATDLVNALASPGGIYTVFAPTDAAFAALPAGTLDELLKPEKKSTLKLIVQHHAAVPIIEQKDMKDGQVVSMSDGTTVTLHVKDGKVMVNDANILGEVHAVNGVVYVVDKVLLPGAK